MSDSHEELKNYADGWIQERKGTDAPVFLKLAFPVIGLCATAYIVLQMFGDVHHATRGKYVQEFNRTSQISPGFQYTVAAMALLYVIITVVFALRTFKED